MLGSPYFIWLVVAYMAAGIITEIYLLASGIGWKPSWKSFYLCLFLWPVVLITYMTGKFFGHALVGFLRGLFGGR